MLLFDKLPNPILNIMKIVIPGGSGQVGTILARHFENKGDEVVILSRRDKNTPRRTVVWDAKNPWELGGRI